MLAVGGAAAVVSGVAPQEVPAWLPAAVIAPPASAALALAGAKAVHGDRLWVEWHRGRLHVEMVLRNGQFVSPTAIEVRQRSSSVTACGAILAKCSSTRSQPGRGRIWLMFELHTGVLL